MKYLPFVSIVVPTYNRQESSILCADALISQKYPKERYEILFIDDGSKDKTYQELSKFAKKNSLLKIFRKKNEGPAKARNLGIKEARGEIIIFIDDDVLAQKDLIYRHVKHYKDNIVGGVGGQIFPKKLSFADKYYMARYLDEIYNSLLIMDPECGMGLATANCSYRASILKKLGGFNEKFPFAAGEDIELSKRVMQERYALLKDPEIIAEHLRSETINSVIRLKFKRMSSVVVEEKLGTLAKNVSRPYNLTRVITQWKNFLKLKKRYLKEKVTILDFIKFIYLTIALLFASIFGKIYFKRKLK